MRIGRTQQNCRSYCINIQFFFFLEEDWEAATTTTAPKAAFNVAVKLVKLGENFVVPPAGSPDFDILANTVTSGFKKTLTKLPEFYKISIDEFAQYVNPNSIAF